MANDSLGNARKSKNDEFYTVYDYIQKEMNAYLEYNPDVFKNKVVLLPCDDPEWSNFTKYFAQNFEKLGLKKLISTSYAVSCKQKQYKAYHQVSLLELNSPLYDESITDTKGKIFTLERDANNSGVIDIEDLQWKYLDGNGDFRSDEVKTLRDEADIIVTNPPFSLFREFVAWAIEAGKKVVLIGNQNAITYKEIFPLLKDNKLWIGATNNGQDMVFGVPEGAAVAPKDREKAQRLGYKGNYTRLGNACWFTNIDHGRRHQPIALMSMADNLKFSKHKQIRESGYMRYDNYDAIEVPYIDAIPNDYFAGTSVPIAFLNKHDTEQFEVVKMCKENDEKDLTYSIESNTILRAESREQRAESREQRAESREQRAESRTNYTVPPNQQTQDVTELWGCLSPSSANTTPNSLSLSGLQRAKERDSRLDCGIRKAELHSRLSVVREDINGYSSRERCNGIMGVPITFLAKHCPEQFEILGITLGNTADYEMTKIYKDAVQHNKNGSTQNGSKVNTRAAIHISKKPIGTVYYTADNVDGYLLSIYPRSVIDWISGVFSDVKSEMRGLEWGRLYEAYHSTAYDPVTVSAKVHELYADTAVHTKAGVFEYILGDCTDTRLLEIRIFEDSTKKAVYEQQTNAAKASDKSNCPLCALGTDNNAKRIWKFTEMDADHVTAWSNGGATDISNCQMLCKTHNRAKGNK